MIAKALRRKIFNRRNVKVSYCTTKNVKAHIDSNNRKVLEGDKKEEPARCNCRAEPCPVQGLCGTKDLVYGAKVITEEPNKPVIMRRYVGQTTRKFKIRYGEHKNSFNPPTRELVRNGKTVSIEEQIEEKRKKSELAAYIWKLRDENKLQYTTIQWSIEKRAFPFKNGSKYCDLCAWEKTEIAKGGEDLLNSRTEIFHMCRNIDKFSLRHHLKNPP